MKTNPDAPRTPCHRIVGFGGSLNGHSAGEGLKTKKEILLKEGVFFKGNKVDMSKSQWEQQPPEAPISKYAKWIKK
ncbi:hypothetical protein BH10PAT2_BH10PAT2_2780 [soil metagenome]